MPAKSKTAYFTKRGNYFGNLWSVYSLKANQVLLLGSDRQLAHWLLKLEFSCSVVSFRFHPTFKDINFNSLNRLDYHVEVIPAEGMIELHCLRVAGYSADYSDKVRAAEKLKYKYIEFNDEHWTPEKVKILSLLRVSSFLSGGRHLYIPPSLRETATEYVRNTRTGSLRAFVSSLSAFDRNLCLLVFCRMYSDRFIDVSFKSNFFAVDTSWWINEE